MPYSFNRVNTFLPLPLFFAKRLNRPSLIGVCGLPLILLAGCGSDDKPSLPEATPETVTQAGSSAVSVPTLNGYASLPAATFEPKTHDSGQYVTAAGVAVPFKGQQPIQGFSGVVKNDDGTYVVLSDNGYGSIQNSADYDLSLYVIKPDLKTDTGGSGNLNIVKTIQLKDPNSILTFPIVNQFTKDRILTGADFDPESIQKAKDGTYWIGEEFGPFLLHFSADGVLLNAPVELPNPLQAGEMLRAPQNPYNEEGATLRYMNALRGHAQLYGNKVSPWFAPYHPEIKYSVTQADGSILKSDPEAHYARGSKVLGELTQANSDIYPLKELTEAGFPVYAWTVNDEATMNKLLKAGVSGLITDNSELAYKAVKNFDANNDGKTGDYLLADGRVDRSRFSLQGHRGSRNLRVQNTLPAFEVGLDNLVNVLESDMQVTGDGKDIINHDTRIVADRCRKADGSAMPAEGDNALLINRYSQEQIQKTFICDKKESGQPLQNTDPGLSPVSVAYASKKGLASPYVMPTMTNLFEMVQAYIDYYENGAGKSHPMAAARAKNAREVWYNIEPKSIPHNVAKVSLFYINPAYGVSSKFMADTYMDVVYAAKKAGLIRLEQIGIQAFDHNFVKYVQETYPDVRTGYLWADLPNWTGKTPDGGLSLQPNEKGEFPWLVFKWPFRVTAKTAPLKVATSGGFEGMAQSPDGQYLYVMQEKPLTDNTSRELLIHQFDIASKRYTGKFYRFPLNAKATAIGDFQMFSPTDGVVIERDDSQGNSAGYKKLVKVRLNTASSNSLVERTDLVDLLSLDNPNGLVSAKPGDVLAGNKFGLPIWTIEGLIIENPTTLTVIVDNNYPFGLGRNSKLSDNNEWVRIGLPANLALK